MAGQRWILQRDFYATNAVPAGSMFGRDGTESEGFEIPEGGQIVAVKWHKFGDVEVTFLVPDN